MTEDTKPQAELIDSISDPPVPVVAAVNTSTRHYISLHATDVVRNNVRVEKYSFERYSLSLCDRKWKSLLWSISLHATDDKILTVSADLIAMR